MAPTALDALYFAGTPYGAKKDLERVHESEGRECKRERERDRESGNPLDRRFS